MDSDDDVQYKISHHSGRHCALLGARTSFSLPVECAIDVRTEHLWALCPHSKQVTGFSTVLPIPSGRMRLSDATGIPMEIDGSVQHA